MNHRVAIFIILALDFVLLLLKIDELSISYFETMALHGDTSLLSTILQTSFSIFGKSDFALRLPMVLFHLSSAVLVYKISAHYLKESKNRVWTTLVFILLPGVVSSALLVHMAGISIFLLLLFIYLYENKYFKSAMLLLALCVAIDEHFIYLYISMFLFALYKKEYKSSLYFLLLMVLVPFVHTINYHGAPKGYFVDSFALYGAVLSPFVFIYIVYALYRKYLTREVSIVWFIAAVPFVLSLLMSFRQRIAIEFFAPYIIVALFLAAQVFEHSYRVRLSQFRKNYRILFTASLLLLLLNTMVVVFNQYIYIGIDEPKKHFSYKFHVAKELSRALKAQGVECVKTDPKMQARLLFYNVTKCNTTILQEIPFDKADAKSVTIRYSNRVVYAASVTKINTN